MPKGVYTRQPHARISKADLKDFVRFCFRADIAKQLEKHPHPHLLAVELYEQATNIKISTQTAYNQRDKWMMVGDELVQINQPTPKPESRKPANRITKSELHDFVRFCFDDDIAELIGNDVHSYKRASELYMERRGKYISPSTVKDQRGRWIISDGEPKRIK